MYCFLEIHICSYLPLTQCLFTVFRWIILQACRKTYTFPRLPCFLIIPAQIETATCARFQKANSFSKAFELLAPHWSLCKVGAKCIANAYLHLHRFRLLQNCIKGAFRRGCGSLGLERNYCSGKKKGKGNTFFCVFFHYVWLEVLTV